MTAGTGTPETPEPTATPETQNMSKTQGARAAQGSEKAMALALRAYPAGYRASYGDELAATAADAAHGRGRWATLAEAGALAAHGLRLRLRIGPDRPLGRLLAWAAPLAVAVDAAVRLSRVLMVLRALHPMLSWRQLQTLFAVDQALAGVALSLLALLALSFGHRQSARLLSVAACAVAAVAALLSEQHLASHGPALWSENFLPLLGPAVAAVLLLAAPLGLTPADGPKRSALAPAAFLLVSGAEALASQKGDQCLVALLALGIALLSAEQFRRPVAVAVLALAPSMLYPVYLVARGGVIDGTLLRGMLVLAVLIACFGLVMTPRQHPSGVPVGPEEAEALHVVTEEPRATDGP